MVGCTGKLLPSSRVVLEPRIVRWLELFFHSSSR